ncbi:MAG TPA: hypothetical protein VFX06_09170 [Stellaceae bacterium]|nr:hypothetical protein [Stellaceae bacterium]
MIKTGLAIAVLSWAPLFNVGSLDPTSNPVGLGLLAWVGSLLGSAIAAIGLIAAVVCLATGRGLR